MEFGLNLFSVRDKLKTKEDLLFCVQRLKENGYKYFQYSGGPFEVERLKEVENSVAPIVLTHVPFDRIINEPYQLMQEHAQFGCKNIGLGMMPIDIISDQAKCKQAIEKLNESAKIFSDNGFKFFYHHHHFEMTKYDGQTVFEYMIENAPYVNFTVDTYWLQYGGFDIKNTIKKLANRIECVHLKDYKIIFENGQFKPTFAPVGEGTINFDEIIQLMQQCGAKYFLVEQDNAVEKADSIQEVCKSIKYLNDKYN